MGSQCALEMRGAELGGSPRSRSAFQQVVQSGPGGSQAIRMAPKRARSPKFYWHIGSHVPKPGERYYSMESYWDENAQKWLPWEREYVAPPATSRQVWKWSPTERRFVCEATPIAGTCNN
jgi:hypothetical protein